MISFLILLLSFKEISQAEISEEMRVVGYLTSKYMNMHRETFTFLIL